MPQTEIHEQIDLSNSVAFGIVMQGFRIRIGRSLITLLGVVFGIAFLMANFTNQIVRDAVREEEQLRSTVKRMTSFLVSEVGLLPGRTIAVIDRGALSPADLRFRTALQHEGATIVEFGSDTTADAIVALGNGPLDWQTIPEAARMAVTAPVDTPRPVIQLLTPPTADEIAAAESSQRAARSRYWWILAISVIVTFMGITNAMLMSVTERFREIGTMKCLGAKSKFIRRLFLIESLLLGSVGGLIGALAGALFSVLVNAIVYGLPLVLALNVTELSVAAAVCFAAGACLTVLSALSPAHVAASMTPAHALRSNV